MYHNITGLILAGGQSKRFGSDKALHVIDGQSMIQRIYDVLSVIADPMFISTGMSDRNYGLPVKHLIDTYPDAGPLAGLHAGLLVADTEWLVVLATDLPFVTTDILKQLIDQCDEISDAVVARSMNRIQPLCGCYRTKLAKLAANRLQQKKRSVMGFLDSLNVKTVDIPGAAMRNINQLSDLQ